MNDDNIRLNGAANEHRTVQKRQILFWAACMPVRFLLIVIAAVCAHYIPRPFAIMVIVAATVLFAGNLYLSIKRGHRWWTPSTSAALALVALIVAIVYLISPRHVNLYLVAGLLAAHQLSGAMHALHVRPWEVI